MRSISRLRRCGFTLIELLVVISIIALLIALLLPSLSQARRTAWTAQGLSNLKGNALACLNYGIDNNDFFPKPFDTTATWKGKFFVAPNGAVMTTAVQNPPSAATVNAGLGNLAMVGYARIWADIVWNGEYVSDPKSFSDPGKLPEWDQNNGAGAFTRTNIARDGTQAAFRDHDPVTGAAVTAYATTGMVCTYYPTGAFHYSSMGSSGVASQRYYDYNTTNGQMLRISSRPWPSENMMFKDSNRLNYPMGFAAYWNSYNVQPHRNGATSNPAGTVASVYFDGHADQKRILDITAFTNAGLNAQGYPMWRATADASGSTYPDLTIYSSWQGTRYWDIRNKTPLGPPPASVNGTNIDSQNQLLGMVDP